MIKTIITDREILSQISRDVVESDDVVKLVKDLQDTLAATTGIGLAAIQIGVPLRVFVTNWRGRSWVFVNPVMQSHGKATRRGLEGCLSVPGNRRNMRRYKAVKFTSVDELGAKQLHKLHDTDAILVQHELDHLNGLTIADGFGV